jgi:two-component system response regulator DevR
MLRRGPACHASCSMVPVPAGRPFVLLRVLVADAGISVNEHLMALLSEIDGLSVFGCAQEPSKILALVQSVHPEVAILDLHTAGPAGLSTIAAMKRLPGAPVVIVVSDYDEPELRRAALATGADHFFVKTTECGRLQDVLRRLQQEAACE